MQLFMPNMFPSKTPTQHDPLRVHFSLRISLWTGLAK
jgi:hypothetical protein